MKKIIYYLILGILLLIFSSSTLQGNQPRIFPADPQKAQLVYKDVENFIQIYKQLLTTQDPLKFMEEKYFKPGTRGLKIFIKKYDLTPQRLFDAIKKQPKKYAGIPRILKWLKTQDSSVREAFTVLKKYIPDAIYPPTYFLIGSFRGIGSGSVAGQLITIEKWDEKGKQSFNTLMIHELVHLNQVKATGLKNYRAIFGPEKSLLALCIREGIAEFFAYLVTGGTTQEEAREYVIKHEKELKKEFVKDMLGKETGDWMWKKPRDPQQPRHIGYSMGFMIARSYYQNAKDKIQAVKEMLSVTDYPAFLKKSKYLE